MQPDGSSGYVYLAKLGVLIRDTNWRRTRRPKRATAR